MVPPDDQLPPQIPLYTPVHRSGSRSSPPDEDPNGSESIDWPSQLPAGDPTFAPPSPPSGGNENSNNNGFNNLDQDGDGFYDGGGNGGAGDGPGSGGKPVVLDLDGDGVELVALEDSTAFYDIHGNGFRYHLSWAAADDGILAYESDGDGQISDREEISFVDYVEGARTDLEGLRHFDTNRDDQLTSADAEWAKFRVWQDLNQDGVSDPGELQTLDEAGIRSISLVSSGEPETRPDGTQVFGQGTYTSGSEDSPVTRKLLDVALRVAPWGFRKTEGGVEIRLRKGEEKFGAFASTSGESVTLDLATAGHNMAVGGSGADRFSNSGTQSVLLAGFGGADVLRGGAGADFALGGAGDDELYGGAGADILDGGTGADQLDGEAGDDALHGGAGADTLDGGAGSNVVSYDTSDAGVTVDLRDADADGCHDTASGGHAQGDSIRNFEHVVGSAHNDVLTGDGGANWLEGGAGRDVLTGGAGDDTLYAGSNDTGGWQEMRGEAGDDTYLIGHKDGNVRIGAAAESATTGNADRVVFIDLTLADLEFTYHDYTEGGTVESAEGVALVIRWTRDGVSGEVRIADMGRHIERFEFADGSTLSQIDADWMARYQPEYYAGDTQDRLVGTSQDDTLTSGAFDDRLDGGSGNDLLDGGSGVDDLYGGFGSDTLMGGEGDDALTGDAGSDELHGGAGDDDTYEFSGRAFGSDTVHDTGGDDTVEFSGEVGWDQLWFSRSGNDLLVELMGTESEVLVEGWWNGALDTDVDASRQVETVPHR